MKIIEKMSDMVYQVEKILAVILLGVMTVTLIAGVMFRYFLNSPLIWSDEVAMFSLVWITFLGGSMAMKRQQLAAVTVFMDRFQGNIRRFLLGVGLTSVALFCLYFLYLSVSWLLSPTIMFEKSDALQIPMLIPYLSVPIGIGFMSVHAFHFFLLSFKADKQEVT